MLWQRNPGLSAIIITPQNPNLGIITSQQILLPPMALDEGSSFTQNILRCGASEKEEASQSCEHLDTSATRQYNHTLDTVWDFAIERLSGRLASAFRTIAFIDPD
ncbi:hypothetical protein GGR51DRAFT_560354 [Nemania sp. FL0031]|nr:hypothetical protein GGR51DRAFT_560354 [Nemania sp. FL0031]